LATPVSSLVALVRQEGCQALLCQDYEYPRFEACLVVGRRVGIPVFASFQGANRPLSPLEKPLRRRAVRSAAGLVVAPRSESVRLQERYGIPPSRIARIFNPLDVAQWAPEDRAAARARLGLAGAAQVVAWHGRVEIATKGLDVLADAWERVTAERAGRELILLLVGTGRDAAQYRDRLGDRQDVRWRDEYVLDKAEIRRYLSAADIYVFPSRDEGFPMAPVEAMASALPVVAADAFGIEDIFDGGERSGGMIVPRGDVAALATALGRLLDDPELRRELGGRARRRAEAAFSTEAVGQQLVRTLFGPRHGA
jgi:glycosyltransferase involved in cell wall biosynthesis